MTRRKQWAIGASSVIVTKTYGFTDYAFRHYQQDGIEYVELSPTWDILDKFDFVDNPERFLSLANKYGLSIWSFHIPFGKYLHTAVLEKDRQDVFMVMATSYIKAGLKIGIKTFVIHPSSEPNEPENRQLLIETSIKNLTILSKLCHDNGAVLAVENLPRTCLCNCASELIRIVKEVPYLQICFDTNHCLIQDNVEFLDELLQNGMKGKIRTIHVSDYDFVDERHWLPKEGKNDWEKIIQKLEELDYSGVFMYEVDIPKERKILYTLEQVKDNAKSLLEG